MRQFDVLINSDAQSASWAPYLIVLQHDFLTALDTVVVAPMYRLDDGPAPLSKINPIVTHEGERLVVSIPELAGILRHSIGRAVGTLETQREAIIAALDCLFTGL